MSHEVHFRYRGVWSCAEVDVVSSFISDSGFQFVTSLYMRIDNADSLLCNLPVPLLAGSVL